MAQLAKNINNTGLYVEIATEIDNESGSTSSAGMISAKRR